MSGCGGSGQETKKEPGTTIQNGYSISIDKTVVDFVYNYKDGGSDAIFVNVSFKGDGVLVGYPEGSEHLQDWLTVETITSGSSSATFKIDWKNNGGVGLKSGVLRFVTGSVKEKKEIYTDLMVNYIFEDDLVISVDSLNIGPDSNEGLRKFGEVFEMESRSSTGEIFTIQSLKLDWETKSSQPWLKLRSIYNRYDSKREDVFITIDSKYAKIGHNTGEINIESVDGTKKYSVKVNLYLDEPETYMALEDHAKDLEFDGFKGEVLKTQNFGLCFFNEFENASFTFEAEIEKTPGLSIVKSSYDMGPTCKAYYLVMDTTQYNLPFESKELVINALFPGKKVAYKSDIKIFVDEVKFGLSHYSGSHSITRGDKSKASFAVQTTATKLSEFSATAQHQWIDVGVKNNTVEYEINTEKLPVGLHSGKIYIQGSNLQLIFNVNVSVVDKLDEKNYFQIDARNATLNNYGQEILTSFSKTEPLVYVAYNEGYHGGKNKGIFSVNYLNGEIEKINLDESVAVASFSVSASGEYIYILDSVSNEFISYSLLNRKVVKTLNFENIDVHEFVVPFMHFGIEYVEIAYKGIYDSSNWERVSDSIGLKVDKVAPSGSYYLDDSTLMRLIFRESKNKFESELVGAVSNYGSGFSNDSSRVFSFDGGNVNKPLYIYRIQQDGLVNERSVNPYVRGAILNSLGDLILYKDSEYHEERLVVIDKNNEVANEIFIKDVSRLTYQGLQDVKVLTVSPDGLKILVFSIDGFIHVFNTYKSQ